MLKKIAVTCIAALASNGCYQASETGQEPVAAIESAITAAPLAAVADTTLRQAVPFGNDGTGNVLGVTAAAGAQLERSLVRFDQTAIEAAAGGQAIVSAHLELTTTGISAGWNGGLVELRAMNRDWPEGNGLAGHGPSWVCADDQNTTIFGNFADHCAAGNSWGMLPSSSDPAPFASAPTDVTSVLTTTSADVRFDVTKDVLRFVAGDTNDGWILLANDHSAAGEWVQFASRETADAPRLILELGDDECPSDPLKTTPGDCGCGTEDVDADLNGIADCPEAPLAPIADTTIRLAVPFGNDGTGSLLGVTSASIQGIERALVRFNQTEIDGQVGDSVLVSAHLELSISGVSTGWGGGKLAAHAMTRDWPEGTGIAAGGHGPSWVCADDQDTTVPGNIFNNCAAADRWGQQPWDFDPAPFQATPTAQATVFSAIDRVIRMDVTSDVERFVNGDPNHGWIITGTTDPLNGTWINFGSRETPLSPRLVLEVRPDFCPADQNKTSAGYCGCGNPETDGDGDGVPDCVDLCPSDPDKQDPGNCGCVGETNLKAAGTACYDALCPGAHTCDGAGTCGDPLDCEPSANCSPVTHDETLFFFCSDTLSFDDARTSCQSQGLDLAKVEDPDDNDFIQSQIGAPAWIGATDAAQEGTWLWSDGETLWDNGGQQRYARFQSGSPQGGDCARLDDTSGEWSTESCTQTNEYVCQVTARNGVAAPSTLINMLERIEDPTQRGLKAYKTFSGMRVLCNVEQGIVVSELEQATHTRLTDGLSSAEIAERMAIIADMCSNLPDKATRTRLLGEFAAGDPLDSQVFAAGSSFGICDAANATNITPARLRANFCSDGITADERAISISAELVENVPGIDGNGPSKQRFSQSAGPAVIGLGGDVQSSTDVYLDRLNNRIPTGDDPPGDGYSMWGVRTAIPCVTGSCDESLGHLCSSEVSNHGYVQVQQDPTCVPVNNNPCPVDVIDHCIAYPILKRHDDIELLGYNFWDSCSAKLVMREHGGPDVFTLDLKGVGNATEGVDPQEACTPSPDGRSLATAGVDAFGTATFSTEAGPLASGTVQGRQNIPSNRFYSLQMFNRNGAYVTRHDVQERQLAGANINDHAPRPIHVCWDCDPTVPDTNCPDVCSGPTDTGCTAVTCNAPVPQTCEEDGCAGSLVEACNPTGGSVQDGTCDAGLWNGQPRDLSNEVCIHEPYQPVRCAETPFWFGSNPGPNDALPLVFIEESEPEYLVEVELERIFAHEKTGPNCGACGNDTMAYSYVTSGWPLEGGPQVELHKPVQFEHEFDHRQVRKPNKIVSKFKLRRNQAVMFDLLVHEKDDYSATSGVLGALAAAVAVIAPVPLNAIGGAALTAGSAGAASQSDYIEGAEEMGADIWMASVDRLLQAHGESRSPNLFADGFPNKPLETVKLLNRYNWQLNWLAGPQVPNTKHSYGQCNYLMHPFDLSIREATSPPWNFNWDGAGDAAVFCREMYPTFPYGQLDNLFVRECGPSYTGPQLCAQNKCFAGRCTNDSIQADGCHPDDQFCGNGTGAGRIKGFLERREISSSADGDGRYIYDYRYTITSCDGNIQPGNPYSCIEP